MTTILLNYERQPFIVKQAIEIPEVNIIVNHLGGKIVPDDVQKLRKHTVAAARRS